MSTDSTNSKPNFPVSYKFGNVAELPNFSHFQSSVAARDLFKDQNLFFPSSLKQQWCKLFVASPQRMQEQTAFVSLLSDFILLFQNKPKCLCLHTLAFACGVCSLLISLCIFIFKVALQTWVSVDERVSLCCC